MPVRCVNDGAVGSTYHLSRGQGRALPVGLCGACASTLSLAEVMRLARSLHVRPAATFRVTTLEAIEASKAAQKGRGGPGSQPPSR